MEDNKNKADQNNTQSIAINENPRANENVRVSTEEPSQTEGRTNDVGSEITDGEAG